jgi:hypothetical protein
VVDVRDNREITDVGGVHEFWLIVDFSRGIESDCGTRASASAWSEAGSLVGSQ